MRKLRRVRLLLVVLAVFAACGGWASYIQGPECGAEGAAADALLGYGGELFLAGALMLGTRAVDVAQGTRGRGDVFWAAVCMVVVSVAVLAGLQWAGNAVHEAAGCML